MSTFLGFSCARSGPSIVRTCRQQARLKSGTYLEPLVGSGRRISTWPSSRDHDSRHRIVSSLQIIQHQWRSTIPWNGSQKRTIFGSKSQTVLTQYVHLPPDYKDEEGLPFRRRGDLDKKTTVALFPGFSGMTPKRATRLLRILHGRRVAGTLDDPSVWVNTASYSQLEISKALEYLRKEVPVDEILNAGLRAEDELRELEAETASSETGPTTEAEEGQDVKKDEKPLSVYGTSVLDKIRAANVARREAEERAEAERQRQEDEAAAQNWGGLAQYDPSLHRGLHPKQLEHYEAATSDLQAPPDTPRWRFLLPTTAFVAAVLASLFLFVSQVSPPRPAREIYPGITEAYVVLGGIVLLNTAMFIAWKRVRLWKYLNKHFILDFVTPRPHQILTAMATHQDPRHLVKTMFLAWAGGMLLAPEVGPAAFLATYVASGMCGYLATLWTHVVRGELIYMFGASSAGFGVICAYFWLYRFDGFKILGLPPDPYEGMQGLGIIGSVMAFFALVPMVRMQGGGVDWMSHLVGMLTGIGCASLMEGPWKAARQRQLERVEEPPVAKTGQQMTETVKTAPKSH